MNKAIAERGEKRVKDYTLGIIEAKFADIIWENEPVPSGRLVKLAEEQLGWKKTTTYSILRKLSYRGLFKNENYMITSLISRDEFYGKQTSEVIDRTFNGSLPDFIAAFASVRKPNQKEIEAIRKMLKEWEK